jgi:hypothetical protein
MNRHYHQVKRRQQSMLNRSAAEVGLDDTNDYWSTIQGKPNPSFRVSYDRSGAALS